VYAAVHGRVSAPDRAEASHNILAICKPRSAIGHDVGGVVEEARSAIRISLLSLRISPENTHSSSDHLAAWWAASSSSSRSSARIAVHLREASRL